MWERLKGMANLGNISNLWAQVVSGIVNLPAKNTIWSVIQRLVLGASVYFIWQERNVRLFSNFGRSEDELLKIIVDSVRSRIMGLKLQVTSDVLKAAEVWSFPVDEKLKYKFLLDDLLADSMDIDDG
ncbi:reverse transcriptase zinc-binding domain-containing protein [Artemisia annua]|uniref:Reverse transcriptase zinc-binding domain-containing protein n=1 Tax=Artemisia annua TaxID=35608 RepID=A0A2U1M6Q2_ARTAN|nr:reverse transcriptase zinc-binding domain-containing protein [Artemisia annua]